MIVTSLSSFITFLFALAIGSVIFGAYMFLVHGWYLGDMLKILYVFGVVCTLGFIFAGTIIAIQGTLVLGVASCIGLTIFSVLIGYMFGSWSPSKLK